MPFRLGMPQRKFMVKFFDRSMLDEMPAEYCYIWYLWYGDTPESILERAMTFIENMPDALELVSIQEILWESNLYD